MIDIDLASGKKGRLVVRSIDEHGNPVSASRTVVDAIQSLLSTSYSPKQGGFLISFDDFQNFLQRVETIDQQEMTGHISDTAKALVTQHQDKAQSLVSSKKDEPQWDLLEQISGWKTRPYADQMQCLQFHIARRRSLEGSETGIGKAAPLDSLVLTPSGWDYMKHIHVGTFVTTPTGPKKVIKEFPQGKKEIFRVTFSDGTATECCDDHLWYTKTRLDRVNESRQKTTYGSVKSLRKIRESSLRITYNKQTYWNHSIPILPAQNYESKKMPIHPYLLGVLLGDGCCKHSVSISSADEDIIRKCGQMLPEGLHFLHVPPYDFFISTGIKYGAENILINGLEELGLMGLGSHEKFIPKEYMFGRIDDRVQLLQGIMDTDGWVQSNSSLCFASSSKRLMQDFCELVQSLGGTTSRAKFKKNHKRGCWQTSIRLPFTPFSLQRKLKSIKRAKKVYQPIRFITKVESIGHKEAKCIKVDSTDGLYVTNNYIVTHNTLTTLYTYLYWKSMGKAKRGLILCTNSGKLDWEKEVEQHTNLTSLTVGNGTDVIQKDLDKYQKGNFDLLILHYDCLFQDSRSRISIFDIARGLPIDFIVLDEAHMLKNPTSKRHKRVVELVETYGDIPLVCATGTAIDGNPRSAWAPLKIIEGRPNHFFPSYVDFGRYFVVREPRFYYRKKVMVDVGFRNLKKLKEMMEPVMIRFLKSEVMGRPSKIYQNRIVTLTGDQGKLYTQVKQQIRNELTTSDGDSISIVNAATKILRLRQILNHPSIIRDVENYNGGSAKYNELDFIVEEILSNPEAQLLVWTQWKAAVDLLVNRYKEHKSIAYYGGSDDRAVRDSVLSKKSRIVIAIPEKAGTSIDWLKGIRTAVYLEKPWSLTLYRQSLDRIDRRVNVDPALIITITAENSVDGFVDAVLQKHQAMFDAITIDDETLLTLGKSELLRYLD